MEREQELYCYAKDRVEEGQITCKGDGVYRFVEEGLRLRPVGLYMFPRVTAIQDLTEDGTLCFELFSLTGAMVSPAYMVMTRLCFWFWLMSRFPPILPLHAASSSLNIPTPRFPLSLFPHHPWLHYLLVSISTAPHFRSKTTYPTIPATSSLTCPPQATHNSNRHH